MPEHKERDRPSKDDSERREAGRKDTGAGSKSDVIAGIGGTGGSSGTGSVRASPHELGDISGIDAGLAPDEVPPPGSIGKGKSGSRTRQMSDGGLSGKTRGDDSETVPNQESASQKDNEKSPKT